MNLLTLDFETFYGKGYTLPSMTNEAYIRDPRFQTIMVGLKMNDRPAFWVPRPQIPAIFAKIPWHETAVLSHHSQFDMAILSWIYNIRPAFICDTIPMFRAIYPTERASLENVAKVLGLPEKGKEVVNAINKRYCDFDAYNLQRYGEYCVRDVDITRMAFDILKKYFPVSELKLIDLLTRLFTEPVLNLNPDLLQQAYDDERERLLDVFSRAFPEFAAEAERAIFENDAAAWKKIKTPLSSNPQFAELLFGFGVDPPKKLSPAAVKKGLANPEYDFDAPIGLLPRATKKAKEAMRRLTGEAHITEKWTYAFSKADEMFKHLLESDQQEVVDLVEARLGVKSTIKESRAKAFIGIASRGTFPIYLKYAAAHTGRLGGGDKVNPQNLNKFCPKCDGVGCERCGDTGVSPMRRAIEAPEGYMLVVRDLSAIEARVNFWLAGQQDKIEAYRQGKDLYCIAASEVFGRIIVKQDTDERFLGKAQVLGCGFGLGFRKLQGMLRIGMLGNKGMLLGQNIADSLGVDGSSFAARNAGFLNETLPPNVSFEDHATHCACSQQIIKLFRDNNKSVVDMWDVYQRVLYQMHAGNRGKILKNGVIGYCPDGFILPNKMLIRYTELQVRQEGKRQEFSILKDKKKGERSKVYGGLCTENVTQGTARIILTDAFLKMREEHIHVVHQVHDEIIAIAPIAKAEGVYERMGQIMSQSPSWARDLPLASEGGWAKQYIK